MSTATVNMDKKSLWGGGRSPFNLSYGKVMMWYFLMSDAFTFGAFLISYGTTRFFSSVWPDPNHVFESAPFFGNANLPLVFVSFMTFVLIVSSVTMVLAVHAGHCNDRKGVIKWMLWTIVGGIIFLSCQAWEWTHLNHHFQDGLNGGAWWSSFTETASEKISFDKLKPLYNTERFNEAAIMAGGAGAKSTHEFFNFFFTITGFHGFHVFSGVIFNIIILFNAINGTYERRGHYEMVEKVGLYWHFVDLVWVFVFTCFYLL